MSFSFFVHLVGTQGSDPTLDGVYRVDSEAGSDHPLLVTAVLDSFHDHIKVPASLDIEIGVKDEAGQWLEESDNEDDPDPDDKPHTWFVGRVDQQAQRQSQDLPSLYRQID